MEGGGCQQRYMGGCCVEKTLLYHSRAMFAGYAGGVTNELETRSEGLATPAYGRLRRVRAEKHSFFSRT